MAITPLGVAIKNPFEIEAICSKSLFRTWRQLNQSGRDTQIDVYRSQLSLRWIAQELNFDREDTSDVTYFFVSSGLILAVQANYVLFTTARSDQISPCVSAAPSLSPPPAASCISPRRVPYQGELA